MISSSPAVSKKKKAHDHDNKQTSNETETIKRVTKEREKKKL